MFPRFTVAQASPGTRFTMAYFPVAHVIHRHMFSPGICIPVAPVFPSHMCSHGCPWHMFLPVNVSPWHISSQGTCLPVIPVDTFETNTIKGHTASQFDHGTCFPTALSRGTCFLTVPCFPLAYVFTRHMFSRGTCVPTMYRGTYFTTAHVLPLHLLIFMKQALKRDTSSHGLCRSACFF